MSGDDQLKESKIPRLLILGPMVGKKDRNQLKLPKSAGICLEKVLHEYEDHNKKVKQNKKVTARSLHVSDSTFTQDSNT